MDKKDEIGEIAMGCFRAYAFRIFSSFMSWVRLKAMRIDSERIGSSVYNTKRIFLFSRAQWPDIGWFCNLAFQVEF